MSEERTPQLDCCGAVPEDANCVPNKELNTLLEQWVEKAERHVEDGEDRQAALIYSLSMQLKNLMQ